MGTFNCFIMTLSNIDELFLMSYSESDDVEQEQNRARSTARVKATLREGQDQGQEQVLEQ